MGIPKTIKIYSKNGTEIEVLASVKDAYIKNGWVTKPAEKKENKNG